MDIDFIYDSMHDEHQVINAGDHSAMCNFLNGNFGGSKDIIEELNQFIANLNIERDTICFAEWTVFIENEEELNIVNNQLLSSTQIDDEKWSDPSWELRCECGKEDFIGVLSSWLEFIKTS